MNRTIVAFVVAAGVSGFACLSNAQDSKKPPHPGAAADQSLQNRGVALPSSNDIHSGEASPARPKPTTGHAVVSGGKSTANSKTKY